VKLIQSEDIREWFNESDDLGAFLTSIGRRNLDSEYVESVLGVPLHLYFVSSALRRERGGEDVGTTLESIPFYSLCKGLFLALSGMNPNRAAQLFGIQIPEPPDTAGRKALVETFITKDIGLTFPEKIACLLGDPFYGNRGGFRRDSLIRIMQRTGMWTRKEILDKLTKVGDIAILYAESRPDLKADPPLTAAEVFETLRLISGRGTMADRLTASTDDDTADVDAGPGRTLQLEILTSLLQRCGKLEAYFLAKLLLRKASFGFEYDGTSICEFIAKEFQAEPASVGHAVALTDTFHVIKLLQDDGPDGLRKVTLQPLVPVRPALANGTIDEVKNYPVWVERKYDGIRFTLHKATDASGSVLCGAYTRNRIDWLEMVPGLDRTIKMIQAANVIVYGELYGTVFDLDGVLPANVFEVYAAMHVQPTVPVTMRFAAFDLLYIEGRDVTGLPLHERRRLLQMVLMSVTQFPPPIAVPVAEGQLANSKEELNRLFGHFRAQGYEGIVSKDPNGPYRLGQRDPNWLKRKPEVTLDLVLLGAILAVTTKENVALYGSYVIGARMPDGTFVDVGDVAGVDKERDLVIRQEIYRNGLYTGREVERQSASGVRPGHELQPGIVVTVRFEGIMREAKGALKLRDPKLVAIRSDKNPSEVDLVTSLEEIYLRQRVG